MWAGCDASRDAHSEGGPLAYILGLVCSNGFQKRVWAGCDAVRDAHFEGGPLASTFGFVVADCAQERE